MPKKKALPKKKKLVAPENKPRKQNKRKQGTADNYERLDPEEKRRNAEPILTVIAEVEERETQSKQDELVDDLPPYSDHEMPEREGMVKVTPYGSKLRRDITLAQIHENYMRKLAEEEAQVSLPLFTFLRFHY